MKKLEIRAATPADVPTILRFVRELAAFERQPDAVKASEADLLRDGFGEPRRFEARIGLVDGVPAGFTLFFPTYSTWEGRPGIWLEDLYVTPEARGTGLGRALVADLAALAVERGFRRLDLSVLDWNPARDFYEKLGIKRLDSWLQYRVTGEALRALAASARSAISS
ncbi:MAG: GNAT family N-acetyltransferase [Rhodospirillales bacterium]|nr:GNAT family N-acetyltransferase [Rhodospirillales bacterium]